MKEIKKKRKEIKLEGGCWAQFCGRVSNFQAHYSLACLTLPVIHAYVDQGVW